MTYYKVILDNGFVGVGTSDDLRKYQKKHNILVFAGGEDAECIEVDGELYTDKWCKPFPAGDFSCKSASVLAISLEEYESLKESIEKEEEIRLDEPEPVVEETTETAENEAEEVTADYVRDVKIREMSLACNKAITDGFDITLHDEKKHFSLTAEDQSNLATATMQILSGETEIPYHADGDEFKNFSADDMLQVINAANEHKTYHMAYFNCIKKWLNSLTRITSIRAIEYGAEIPKKYQSAFLRTLYEG